MPAFVLSVNASDTYSAQLEAPPSPSWLVSIAAYGYGKEKARKAVLQSVAQMCTVGLTASLVIDVAAAPKGIWESWILEGGSLHSPQLQCSSRPRKACLPCFGAQVMVRYHSDQIGTMLTAEHLALFRANIDRFDWFLYSEVRYPTRARPPSTAHQPSPLLVG